MNQGLTNYKISIIMHTGVKRPVPPNVKTTWFSRNSGACVVRFLPPGPSGFYGNITIFREAGFLQARRDRAIKACDTINLYCRMKKYSLSYSIFAAKKFFYKHWSLWRDKTAATAACSRMSWPSFQHSLASSPPCQQHAQSRESSVWTQSSSST